MGFNVYKIKILIADLNAKKHQYFARCIHTTYSMMPSDEIIGDTRLHNSNCSADDAASESQNPIDTATDATANKEQDLFKETANHIRNGWYKIKFRVFVLGCPFWTVSKKKRSFWPQV